MLWELLRGILADGADEVQQEEGSQAHCGITSGSREALERVDDDQIGGRARIEAGDAHESWDLTNSDIQGGAGHEGRD